jgi:hypothetical protein
MYKVEKIIDSKEENGKILYKIKWQGWSMKDCTWEPIENLDTIEDMIEEFNNRKSQDIPSSNSNYAKKTRGRPKGATKNPLKSSPKSHLPFVDNKQVGSKDSAEDSSTDDMEVRVVPAKEKKKEKKEEEEKKENIADLRTPIEESEVLTESFVDHDEDRADHLVTYEIPEKILSSKQSKKDGILFLCQWKERKDGSRLKECFITNEAMITYFPSLLIKFYQEKHFSN